MWILSILLGLAFTSSLMADPQEDLQRCVEKIDIESLENLIHQAESHLDTVCPMMLNFLDCIEDVVVKATGFSIDDLAKMAPTSQVGKGARLITNIRSVLRDLCTDGTELNIAYRENAECFENIQVDSQGCESTARDVIETYKAFEDTVQEEAGMDTRDDNRHCMVQAYTSACMAAQIHDECGKSGFELFQTIIKRSSVFSLALCTQEDLQTLKTKFVDSLDLEEDRRDIFRLAFDLRKRRK